MNNDELMQSLSMTQLPKNFFEGKSGRNYRFHIFEDIVKAGGSRPTTYTDSSRDWIQGLYREAKAVALYSHVPWCVEECTYCYYWGKIEKRSEMERLQRGEQAHARLMDDVMGLREKEIPSLYFGGGTPTVLPRDLLEEQLAFFTGYKMTPDAEVCVEASIGTLTDEKFQVLEKYVTRLSIGIQSFNDRLLGMVARTFSRGKAIDALQEAIRRIPSVNIDLLFGMRTQTMPEFLETIETAIRLGTPSVTLYRLEIRDDPPLAKEFNANPSQFPDELACRVMRKEAKTLLEDAGYRENLVGWFLSPKVTDTKVYRERWQKQTPCVAFGPHVQNYGRGHFYNNLADKESYLARVAAGSLPIGSMWEIGILEQMYIFILAQWKSNQAVVRKDLLARFNAAMVDQFVQRIQKHIEFGLIQDDGSSLSLTASGTSLIEWVLDDVIAEIAKARPANVLSYDPKVALPVV